MEDSESDSSEDSSLSDISHEEKQKNSKFSVSNLLSLFHYWDVVEDKEHIPPEKEEAEQEGDEA